MYRSAISRVERPPAMRTVGPVTLDLLLPAAARERREPASAAAIGRTVPGVPILRQSSHGGHAGSESQAHAAADANRGNRSPLSETELEPPIGEPRGLSVLTAGRLDRT